MKPIIKLECQNTKLFLLILQVCSVKFIFIESVVHFEQKKKQMLRWNLEHLNSVIK